MQGVRDLEPGPLVGRVLGEVQGDAVTGASEHAGELEEALAQRAHLSVGELRAGGVQAQPSVPDWVLPVVLPSFRLRADGTSLRE